MSGFGTRFFDYDNDGHRDLFMANGHVLDNIQRYHSEVAYAEPKLMFHNNGRGVFENVSDQMGPDFLLPRVSRGAAVGDFDNDGDLDILVSNNGQVPQLLRNDGHNTNHWLEILLIGTKSLDDIVIDQGHELLGDARPAKRDRLDAVDEHRRRGRFARSGQRNADVGMLAFAWPVHDAAHHRDIEPFYARIERAPLRH